jgi:UDP-N-acetylglucosamine 2-epimerase
MLGPVMKLLTVLGARPQFVKAAAVSRVIADLAARQPTGSPDSIDEVIVHTGQHYDPMMSDVFFDELGIPQPAHRLDVGSANHGEQTGEIMRRLEPIVLTERPDVVLVYGDTNSTLAGALVSAKIGVPIAHVEAGLRSFDRNMPEEINRVVTDHVSDLLLCPSATAISNLSDEGITCGVTLTGDVMYDVLLHTVAMSKGAEPVAQQHGLRSDRYVVATLHRASNTNDPELAAAIFDAFSQLARLGTEVVFPAHPRTRALAMNAGLPDGVHVIDPVGYADMVGLVSGAVAVVTDSGGLQKEAAWLGTPCITVRNETEWVETVECGWNVIVGTDTEQIVHRALTASPPDDPFTAYGDGTAAVRVVECIIDGAHR